MGLIVDFVNLVDEVCEFCCDGLLYVIIIELVLCGDCFNELCLEVEVDGVEVVFIEIIEEGNIFEILGFGGLSMVCVGCDVIFMLLFLVLMFELVKMV